ncbi:caspase a-like isoform X2 [Conger conger]|uniref:caspase a-like isoform X2 n=1 Tax=Conger conger TaxID=82655 RepID=UPI002A5AC2B1|nr:caspase a-like isoform X2 [Conger conger]
MADKLLFDARKELVERVSSHVLLQLLDDLLQDRVLNDGEKDAVIEENKSTADKARCLLDKVRKRGPKASGKFISRLQERDPDLCELLNLGPVSPPAPQAPSELSLPLPQQEVTCSPSQQEASAVLIPCTPQFKKALLEKEGAEIYPMKEKGQRKRMALLINNVKFDHLSERRGAEKDKENMEKLLEALGYTVEPHRDLSAQDIDEAVKRFSQHQAHLESDSTFVVIMSHGKRDAICGIHYNPKHPQENNLFLIDNIFTHLNTENCAGLRNKPKVIVIQACRGGEIGTVWVSDSASAPKSLEDDGMWRELKERDFACLMACTPDTKAYRDREKGAFLIQKLVETIKTHAHKDHIEELFRKVRNQFDGSKLQMPVTDRTSLGATWLRQ